VGRLFASQPLHLGPDLFTLGKRLLQFGLDPAALVRMAMAQLGALS